MLQGLHGNSSSGQLPSLNWGVASETETRSTLRKTHPLALHHARLQCFRALQPRTRMPAKDAGVGVTILAEPRSQMYYHC